MTHALRAHHIGWTALLLTVAVETATLGARPQQVFRSGVRAVRLDVVVTRDARPVTGLVGSDFLVRDNGVHQHVALAAVQSHVNLVVVIGTGGVFADPKRLFQSASLLDGFLKPTDVVSVVSFAQTVHVNLRPTTDRPALQAALRSLRPEMPHAANPLWDVVVAGASLSTVHDGPTLMALFSDGANYRSWLTEDDAFGVVGRSDVVVYPVTPIRQSVHLHRLADSSGGSVIVLDPGEAGIERLGAILDEFRHRYVLTYTPRGVESDDGWHRLDVRLADGHPDARVRARQRYFAGD